MHKGTISTFNIIRHIIKRVMSLINYTHYLKLRLIKLEYREKF